MFNVKRFSVYTYRTVHVCDENHSYVCSDFLFSLVFHWRKWNKNIVDMKMYKSLTYATYNINVRIELLGVGIEMFDRIKEENKCLNSLMVCNKYGCYNSFSVTNNQFK